MTDPIRCPIVGSKFYPPAMEILLVLPVGTPLRALAEPTNPHDANAVQVWIDTTSIPQKARERLIKTVPSLNSSRDSYQLGHIAASFAAMLNQKGFPDEVTGTFAIGSKGGNRILLEIPL